MKKKFLFFYERLSREDGDDESCSITNQRRLLNRFKEEHSEFHDYQVEEFIDDGYTGSNFNRPNFQNMMSRVRSLYGNMIVIATKDFSRLGRDTIDTVNYLEKIFPFLEVRYIAINDDYDSKDYQYGIDFEAKFKNLINGLVPIQASTIQKRIKMEEALQGKHNGPVPLYGYRYTVDREYEVDWEAASVLQIIMDLLDQKKSYKFIIKFLAEKGIDPPSVYLAKKYNAKLCKTSSAWNKTTLKKIARNKAYLGYSVRHKEEACVLGTKGTRAVNKADQILVPNRQPKIIREEQFNRVNEWLDERAAKSGCKSGPRRRVSALYKNVYCVHCGSALSRRRYHEDNDFYYCLAKRENPLSDCTFPPIETAVLEKEVCSVIQFNLRLFTDSKKKISKALNHNMADSHAIMERFQERAEEIEQKKMNLYEDYRAGHVSREEYLIKKQKLSEQLVPLEVGIQKVEEGIRKYDEANIIFYSDFARLVDEFRNEEALSPELANAFIEKVLVDKNHNIEVVFKFQDEINMLCMRKAG